MPCSNPTWAFSFPLRSGQTPELVHISHFSSLKSADGDYEVVVSRIKIIEKKCLLGIVCFPRAEHLGCLSRYHTYDLDRTEAAPWGCS